MHSVRAAATLALAAAIWVPAAAGSDAGRDRSGLSTPVTVMTRNVYLGTDLFPIFDALAQLPAGTPQEEVVEATAAATYEARLAVDRTDFARRAEAIADEIVAHDPELVGLQEVALWRSGPLEVDNVGVPNAEYVDYNFEQILLEALAARDADYRVAVRLDEADLEAPSFGPAGERPRDVRVTLRDVVLVKDGVETLDTGRGHYRRQFAMPAPGPDIEFTRGYTWVDVRRGGERLRFVNTHLEVRDSLIGQAQARELAAGPGAVRSPVIVVCDCNSDPLKMKRSLPYRALVDAGFADQWLTLGSRDPGLTCCVSDFLTESAGRVLDSRVDFVLARAGRRVRAESGALLGDPRGVPLEARPSDHAGLVLTVRSVNR